ncbi:MAG: 2-oxo acid dehydrogenase subunit E2 [Nitrospirae bacterium]|nr:MAG: 2-oxo acid dehydrogenase subunit E2 [Nitrospirota bacterium]
MITRVVMPKLTDTMEEGVVVAWKKQEGDPVMAGDVLAEIETDKAVMDLEAFGSGFLRKILVNEGETVKAGRLIAVIAELDEDIAPALEAGGSSPSSEAQAAGVAKEEGRSPSPATAPSSMRPETVPPMPDTATQPVTRVPISPRARQTAQALGVNLADVRGTGPDGTIVERDVLAYAHQQRRVPPGATIEHPLSQMRKAIARVTTQSKGPVPHFYLTMEIAMDHLEQLRRQWKSLSPEPLSHTAMFVRAVTLALMRHPEINVSFAGESIRYHTAIDIGIAVALDDGLVTPVLRNCAEKSLTEIAREASDLIARARAKQLTPAEYSEATFSISNLGEYGVENFLAVLMPPQAAALAIGAIQSVPVADGETLKVGRRMKVTLSCDHRALDGAQGAKFLQTLKSILEHPLEIFLPPNTC